MDLKQKNFRWPVGVCQKLEAITNKVDPTIKNESYVVRNLIEDKYMSLYHDTLPSKTLTINEKIEILSNDKKLLKYMVKVLESEDEKN